MSKKAGKFADVEMGDAYFSEDRIYRYALSRVWDGDKPMMMFIGLNPSTADETKLDPTIKKVITFARRDGFGGIWMLNLFAFRATDPIVMKMADDPVGDANDMWLLQVSRWVNRVVCGWGTHGVHRGRNADVKKLLMGGTLHCLGLSNGGHPLHPLYLSSETPVVVYQSALWRP